VIQSEPAISEQLEVQKILTRGESGRMARFLPRPKDVMDIDGGLLA
jgi:hypothetical protein